jgi:hypothetical protein
VAISCNIGRRRAHSCRSAAQQWFSEHAGKEIIEEEQQLGAPAHAAAGLEVEWHDRLDRNLPSLRHIGKAGIHGALGLLAERRVESELDQRNELVQPLLLGRPASETAGQVIRAELDREAPVHDGDLDCRHRTEDPRVGVDRQIGHRAPQRRLDAHRAGDGDARVRRGVNPASRNRPAPERRMCLRSRACVR